MSLFDSLLTDLEDHDREHLLKIIAQSVADDRQAVVAGDAPRRHVDVGSRIRRTRAELNSAGRDNSASDNTAP
ncbi:hypothetical protein AB1484_18240 [Parafrankia sp. FMc6]|uniref:hypothetical protein n=1 Tax=Parafrankia soli TaxID=2599596 RepID=UPI0034D7014C